MHIHIISFRYRLQPFLHIRVYILYMQCLVNATRTAYKQQWYEACTFSYFCSHITMHYHFSYRIYIIYEYIYSTLYAFTYILIRDKRTECASYSRLDFACYLAAYQKIYASTHFMYVAYIIYTLMAR